MATNIRKKYHHCDKGDMDIATNPSCADDLWGTRVNPTFAPGTFAKIGSPDQLKRIHRLDDTKLLVLEDGPLLTETTLRDTAIERDSLGRLCVNVGGQRVAINDESVRVTLPPTHSEDTFQSIIAAQLRLASDEIRDDNDSETSIDPVKVDSYAERLESEDTFVLGDPAICTELRQLFSVERQDPGSTLIATLREGSTVSRFQMLHVVMAYCEYAAMGIGLPCVEIGPDEGLSEQQKVSENMLKNWKRGLEFEIPLEPLDEVGRIIAAKTFGTQTIQYVGNKVDLFSIGTQRAIAARTIVTDGANNAVARASTSRVTIEQAMRSEVEYEAYTDPLESIYRAVCLVMKMTAEVHKTCGRVPQRGPLPLHIVCGTPFIRVDNRAYIQNSLCLAQDRLSRTLWSSSARREAATITRAVIAASTGAGGREMVQWASETACILNALQFRHQKAVTAWAARASAAYALCDAAENMFETMDAPIPNEDLYDTSSGINLMSAGARAALKTSERFVNLMSVFGITVMSSEGVDTSSMEALSKSIESIFDKTLKTSYDSMQVEDYLMATLVRDIVSQYQQLHRSSTATDNEAVAFATLQALKAAEMLDPQIPSLTEHCRSLHTFMVASFPTGEVVKIHRLACQAAIMASAPYGLIERSNSNLLTDEFAQKIAATTRSKIDTVRNRCQRVIDEVDGIPSELSREFLKCVSDAYNASAMMDTVTKIYEDSPSASNAQHVCDMWIEVDRVFGSRLRSGSDPLRQLRRRAAAAQVALIERKDTISELGRSLGTFAKNTLMNAAKVYGVTWLTSTFIPGGGVLARIGTRIIASKVMRATPHALSTALSVVAHGWTNPPTNIPVIEAAYSSYDPGAEALATIPLATYEVLLTSAPFDVKIKAVLSSSSRDLRLRLLHADGTVLSMSATEVLKQFPDVRIVSPMVPILASAAGVDSVLPDSNMRLGTSSTDALHALRAARVTGGASEMFWAHVMNARNRTQDIWWPSHVTLEGTLARILYLAAGAGDNDRDHTVVLTETQVKHLRRLRPSGSIILLDTPMFLSILPVEDAVRSVAERLDSTCMDIFRETTVTEKNQSSATGRWLACMRHGVPDSLGAQTYTHMYSYQYRESTNGDLVRLFELDTEPRVAKDFDASDDVLDRLDKLLDTSDISGEDIPASVDTSATASAAAPATASAAASAAAPATTSATARAATGDSTPAATGATASESTPATAPATASDSTPAAGVTTDVEDSDDNSTSDGTDDASAGTTVSWTGKTQKYTMNVITKMTKGLIGLMTNPKILAFAVTAVMYLVVNYIYPTSQETIVNDDGSPPIPGMEFDATTGSYVPTVTPESTTFQETIVNDDGSPPIPGMQFDAQTGSYVPETPGFAELVTQVAFKLGVAASVLNPLKPWLYSLWKKNKDKGQMDENQLKRILLAIINTIGLTTLLVSRPGTYLTGQPVVDAGMGLALAAAANVVVNSGTDYTESSAVDIAATITSGATDTTSPSAPLPSSRCAGNDIDKSRPLIQLDTFAIAKFAGVSSLSGYGTGYELPLVVTLDPREPTVPFERTESRDAPRLIVSDHTIGPAEGDTLALTSLHDANSLVELVDEIKNMLNAGRLPVVVIDPLETLDIITAATEAACAMPDHIGARSARFIVPTGRLLARASVLWRVDETALPAMVVIRGMDVLASSIIVALDRTGLALGKISRTSIDIGVAAIIGPVYDIAGERGTTLTPGPPIPDRIKVVLTKEVNDYLMNETAERNLQLGLAAQAHVCADVFVTRAAAMPPSAIRALRSPLNLLYRLYHRPLAHASAAQVRQRRAAMISAVLPSAGLWTSAAIASVEQIAHYLYTAGTPAGIATKIPEFMSIMSSASVLTGIVAGSIAIAYAAFTFVPDGPLRTATVRAMLRMPFAPLEFAMSTPCRIQGSLMALQVSGIACSAAIKYRNESDQREIDIMKRTELSASSRAVWNKLLRIHDAVNADEGKEPNPSPTIDDIKDAIKHAIKQVKLRPETNSESLLLAEELNQLFAYVKGLRDPLGGTADFVVNQVTVQLPPAHVRTMLSETGTQGDRAQFYKDVRSVSSFFTQDYSALESKDVLRTQTFTDGVDDARRLLESSLDTTDVDALDESRAAAMLLACTATTATIGQFVANAIDGDLESIGALATKSITDHPSLIDVHGGDERLSENERRALCLHSLTEFGRLAKVVAKSLEETPSPQIRDRLLELSRTLPPLLRAEVHVMLARLRAGEDTEAADLLKDMHMICARPAADAWELLASTGSVETDHEISTALRASSDHETSWDVRFRAVDAVRASTLLGLLYGGSEETTTVEAVATGLRIARFASGHADHETDGDLAACTSACAALLAIREQASFSGGEKMENCVEHGSYDCEHAATMQGLAQGVGRRFGIGETFARSTLSADEWRYMWWPWFTDHN